MDTALALLGGVGGAVIAGVAVIVFVGALVLMHNSRKLGETT